MKRLLTTSTAAALATLLLFTARAGAFYIDVIQATDADRPLAIVVSGEEIAVYRDERTEALELPAHTSLFAIEAVSGGWIAAGTRTSESGQDLFLLRSLGAEAQELPAPERLSPALRGSPRLAVEGGMLRGIVWLEGTRQEDLSVWAVPWQDDGWGKPELVSPPGPGAQLAPSVAVLADGSWLLVWAAVDGEDDEILWSRRTESGWTLPARVHPDNSVPDVTPVVSPLDDGALVAWTFLDGRHFRLRAARFDGARWEVSDPFGLDGSHRPRVVRRAGSTTLLYRTASPAGWAVRAFDGAGRATASVFFPLEDGRPPILDLRDPAGVLLSLPAAEGSPPTSVWAPWGPRP